MHPNLDGLWWVVRGRVAFYTTGHKLLAELHPEEAVFIPRDFPYYFESIGDEDLEMLQVESLLKQGERIQTVLLDEKAFDLDYDVTYYSDTASK